MSNDCPRKDMELSIGGCYDNGRTGQKISQILINMVLQKDIELSTGGCYKNSRTDQKIMFKF